MRSVILACVAFGALAGNLQASSVGLELRPTGPNHEADLWVVPEVAGQEVVGIQTSLVWDPPVGVSETPMVEALYHGFHPSHPWNESIQDGDALWLFLCMPLSLPQEGLPVATFSWPEAVEPLHVSLVAGIAEPWTWGTVVIDVEGVQLWDGVESSVTLPEPGVGLLLGLAAIGGRRQRGVKKATRQQGNEASGNKATEKPYDC